ncbi:MAG TPA: 30S ribosomal protein S20 [Candidatus Omnitrophota bacterium]|nr:30S ribosomal protein S20 [Candidatus Omnitrophota bacterium]HPS19465.1 30S ribosomal protein S20 [Candidatus Omnitrophota bacterium]
MPQLKSAFKRLKQNKKRRAHNKAKMSEVRTQLKVVHTLLAENKSNEAETALRKLESQMARAAKTCMIKKNAASRTMSRLKAQLDSKKTSKK